MDAIDSLGLNTAIAEAQQSYAEGGIPIGAALVHHGTSKEAPKLIACGHNERIQKASATLHGEISCLENAGRQKAEFTTLSPCMMCTGAILLYRIPRVVIGENTNFLGGEDLLRTHGVEVVVLNNAVCKELMTKFIAEKPEEWNEDIGEENSPPDA
ncbi:uncharacterized protein PHACADRAFT_203477 [Phanerochaete carnosa HHB-10118-sp]|uniref:Cytosine deaminase n=1 Tax=Phanerochaete carnosa (strain HHB-10118-sp) TaxID=650164 RepID=K5WLC1_PHACS|nr:uncharacterized protein PHACADRAFT_203477 [Phanerochaete carnosa HHB-10118-sp]EKM60230.1 hypothetical protein PHACADRAFT_203477 [Phanerochaete carnosa HHB-10118-sp]